MYPTCRRQLPCNGSECSFVFLVEMFIQDYAWLRCWQGYSVHERWLGLVEGVDLENVLFSVLKLIDIACGSPWTQAVCWQGYSVHERWLGLVEGVDLENVLFSVLKLIDIACGSPWTLLMTE